MRDLRLAIAIFGAGMTFVGATPVVAQTQGEAATSSTLNMTLPSNTVKVASAKKKPASQRQVASRNRAALASRGAGLRSLPALRSVKPDVQTSNDPVIPGRVGVIRVESAPIFAGRQPGAKSLALVTEGTNLAILMEKEGYYGILMQDSTLGWIPTGDVELLDYRVQVRIPEAVADSPDSPVPSADTSTNTSSPDLGNTDPHTASLLREAFSYMGVPYVWAGNTRSGLDCSAFVKNVFSSAWGVKLPRHSGDQAKYGSAVNSTADLRAGDRLYFDMGRKGRISHTGIYIGNGYFIHASSNHHCVAVDQLAKSNYWNALVSARRDGG